MPGHELEPVQGPVQRFYNDAPRLDLPGHGDHHAQQRHALLVCLAGFAGGTDGDLGAGSGKGALLLGQLFDGNTYNYGYIGSRATGNEAGRLPGGRPRLEGRDARRDQESFPIDDSFSLAGFAPSSSTPTTCRMWKGAGGIQGAAAFRVSEATRAAGRRRKSIFPATDGVSRRTSSSISTLLSSSCHRRQRPRISAPNSPGSASDPGKTFEFKDLRWNTRPPSCWA